ncbi:CHASE2 domain-containing protein [Arcobacter sp. YIC-464]|uniref:CHASE2 domain-containing protein n=1 Tax=Arcobacter sp. YIC-464 TaxID=3376631 RepID=UPI003C183C2E
MKKSDLKKLFIYINVALILFVVLSSIYIFFPKLPDSIDNRLRDYLFTIRGEIPTSQNVVIVDIDEKSLQELGQWPWSRNKVSHILKNLTDAQVAIIGFDVVFAEEDSSSPHKVLNELNIKRENIPNYDLEFAKTVASTPTILGYLFELQDKKYIKKEAPKIPAIYIEKNKKLGDDYLINAKGVVMNIPLVQDNSYSSGFFNNIPDEAGIIRSVPLVISYDDMIYPSLSLELLRILLDTNKVFINYDEQGVSSITVNDIQIPTDRHGRLLVNFRGKEKTFKYISANDIYNNTFDKKDIEGKIVLIGTSAAGLLDLRATPFESVFPGVEVHANVIDNIIQGDFLYKASWVDGANIFIIFTLSILIVLLIKYTPFWMNPIISILFLTITTYVLYEVLFTYGIVLNIFFPLLTIVLGAILATLFDYFYEIKQEEAIKKKFASKVSKEVMESLLKNVHSNEFEAMEKEVTVFFSDVRNFTKISEKMGNAKKLIEYLNQYMEPMSNIIIKYEGTIDKYIGDAIMAYWNAPADVKKHADKALLASIEQIESLKTLNEKLEKQNKPLIDIGIGLNTGLAVVGEMGSSGRSDYTVIGDAINLGARLESLCKFYDSKINISNFTKERLKEEYIFRFLDLVKVKGKEEPVQIWQVHGKGKASKQMQEELDTYNKAIELYQNSMFLEALEIFKNLDKKEDKTNRKIYKIYIKRCEEFIKTPPSNFNGIYEHSTKA